MHFYMRNAKLEDIEKFLKDQKLKFLGMPEYISSGSHEIEQLKHRFLVLPRFGRDITKIFEENNRKFPLHTVYRVGLQILNALQYIHSCTYVHADIKGSNILLGFGKGGDERVYLLDYGLACRYNTKEFKPNPKKAHDGTIEYTSRDAHQGVPTMRGDIEILAYNIIEWAGAQLPWVAKNILTKPVEVQKLKEDFMKTVDKSLRSCFGSIPVPTPITNMLKYLTSMKPDTQPDYAKLRGFLEAGLKELGQKNSGALEFGAAKASTAKGKAAAASPKKGARKKPDFSSKDEEEVPGPSRKAPAAVKRGRAAVARTHVDTESDDEREGSSPKKKTPAAKKAQAENPTDKSPVQDREKRNRVRKQYIEESDSENEAPKTKSPRKRGKAQIDSPGELSESPPQKKPKGKPLKPELSEPGSGSGKSTVTLKSKSENKNKKTITLNFNLDVSMNSDVVVVLNRKDKKKEKGSDEKKSDEDDVPSGKDENEPVNNRAGFYKGKHAKK